jgi:hypothetical protein
MSDQGPTPEQILAVARSITADHTGRWGAAWPRAAGFLTRQALEEGIDRTWTGPLAEMRGTPRRHQLLCLPTFLSDPDLARRVAATWYQISSACHAHPYELNPTAGELRQWADVTANLLGLQQIHVQSAMRSSE